MRRCGRVLCRRIMPLLLSGGLLSGCAAVAAPGAGRVAESRPPGKEAAKKRARPAPAGKGTCAAARYQAMVGRPIGEVDTAALPQPLRVYSFGSRITADHRPERMNVVLEADGRVRAIHCG